MCPTTSTSVRTCAFVAAVLVFGLASSAFAGDQALLDAARADRFDDVKARLAAGADPNDYAGGYSPLQFAASNGNAAMVTVLLAKDASPAHQDHNRDSALEWAAYAGHAPIIRLLLAAKADPNIRQRAEATPLFAAARRSMVDAVKALLEGGADARLVDHIGSTALREAALGSSDEIVGLLIAAKVPVNAQDRILFESALHVAATYGRTSIVGRLLEAGASVDALDVRGVTPLWRAAEQGHLDTVKRLLDAKASVAPTEKRPESAFAVATRNGHLDVARLLVERTPDLGPAFVASAAAASIELMDRLLARGVDLQSVGAQALVGAANSPLAITKLLELQVPVDTRDERGFTALLEAAGYGNVESVRLLLARGADPTVRSISGLDAEKVAAARRSFYEGAIKGNENSRADHGEQPELIAALAALTKRHAEIRELLAAAAKTK